jgi:hypothetical protein
MALMGLAIGCGSNPDDPITAAALVDLDAEEDKAIEQYFQILSGNPGLPGNFDEYVEISAIRSDSFEPAVKIFLPKDYAECSIIEPLGQTHRVFFDESVTNVAPEEESIERMIVDTVGDIQNFIDNYPLIFKSISRSRSVNLSGRVF